MIYVGIKIRKNIVQFIWFTNDYNGSFLMDYSRLFCNFVDTDKIIDYDL